jgi:2-haloacid dehalogenase
MKKPVFACIRGYSQGSGRLVQHDIRGIALNTPYRWLLFDADGTLFDFGRAEVNALTRSFAQFDLPMTPAAAEIYREVNRRCWQALERGELSPEALRTRRFALLFAEAGLAADVDAFAAAYLENLAQTADLLEGAAEVLAALRGRYRFAIITNGLRTVQRGRLARSAIRADIAALIISEEVGAAKPEPGIFDAAFAAMGGPAKSEVLLIGDSLSADIRGAREYGIDACWFNPAGVARPAATPITYEIRRLDELIALLA